VRKYVTEYSKGRPAIITEAKVVTTSKAVLVKYNLPENGRGVRPAPLGPPSAPSRTGEPQNGGAKSARGGPGYLWPDGTRRVLPPPDEG
jgi:hypothetical protein